MDRKSGFDRSLLDRLCLFLIGDGVGLDPVEPTVDRHLEAIDEAQLLRKHADDDALLQT